MLSSTLFALSATLLAGLADAAPYSKPHELVVWRPKIIYPVGEIDEDSQKLIRVTRECTYAGIGICKPGALFRDIGKAMCVSPLPP